MAQHDTSVGRWCIGFAATELRPPDRGIAFDVSQFGGPRTVGLHEAMASGDLPREPEVEIRLPAYRGKSLVRLLHVVEDTPLTVCNIPRHIDAEKTAVLMAALARRARDSRTLLVVVHASLEARYRRHFANAGVSVTAHHGPAHVVLTTH